MNLSECIEYSITRAGIHKGGEKLPAVSWKEIIAHPGTWLTAGVCTAVVLVSYRMGYQLRGNPKKYNFFSNNAR